MLKTSGKHFVDKHGRHVILHGVNMVCKDSQTGYIGNWNEQDFRNLKKWGMNVVRFGVIWDGLEPNPGIYGDAYIEKLRELIQLANTYDLMIVLDMHQDLFSERFGDGAPAWATITDGETYEHGEVWSDAYLFNKAVQTSFDHFWHNTPGPTGMGIQDHYIQAWKHLVKKLHNEPNVIGYDMMNEPFIGRDVDQVTEAMFGTFAKLYEQYYGKIDIDQLFASWHEPEQKHEFLSFLNDLNIFKQIVDAPTPILQPFEANILSQFFQNIATEIRKIDKHGILFLETNYFSNLGTESMIQPLKDDNGRQDKQQAYAPHAYDIVTDTELDKLASHDRLSFIFERHEKTRERLKIPMLIGEWGAYYNSDDTGHVSLYIQRLMERLLCSDTYWDYTPNMHESTSFYGIHRGYPMTVAGDLLYYHYERAVETFHMKWIEKEGNDKPTIVYLPNINQLKDKDVTLHPIGSTYSVHEIEDSQAGFIKIPSIAHSHRSLVVICK